MSARVRTIAWLVHTWTPNLADDTWDRCPTYAAACVIHDQLMRTPEMVYRESRIIRLTTNP